MLQADSVCKAFDSLIVLDGVSFSIEEHSIVGLIGPSGGGKSTLLKIMGGVTEADEGSLDCGSIEQEDVSLMFQEGALFDSLTVFENVAFPMIDGLPVGSLERKKREEIAEKVYDILSRVGLAEAALKVPAQLSGGMRRRASLARALVSKPSLLLLDDPTCGLDPVASSVIMDLIQELHQELKPTTVIVSHDLRRLLPVVDSVMALFDGAIQFHGSLEEIRSMTDSALWQFIDCRFDLDQSSTQESMAT